MLDARRPKVMFIINSLIGGGAERVMTTLLAHSRERARSIDMSLTLLDDDRIAYPPPAWIRVHQLRAQLRTLPSFLHLRALIGSEKPDVTLSFLTRANVANGFAMAGRGRPWIISERINTAVQLGTGLRALVSKALVRATYPHASRIIAVSGGVAEGLVQGFGVSENKIDVISNPVALEYIRARATEAMPVEVAGQFVMAMGRLVGQKNFALLIEAFARSGLPGQLVIGGEGPLRPQLEQQAAGLGISDRVVLTGFLENPYPLLARARAFILSSNGEGFPNALVEALALGVPAIATNCPDGPAEILVGVRRQELRGLHIAPAGIIVPVGDADTMAQALCLIQNDEVRERIVCGGLERVMEYSTAAAVQRYWQVIDEMLARTVPASKGHATA